MAVFGEVPSYASELVLWASDVTETCASVIKRNVLLSSAAAGGLRGAVECVQIALGHCALLEERGLTLCPTLSKLIRPSVEQAMKANLTSTMESVNSLAAADNWTMDTQRGPRGTVSSLRLTTSGHRFLFLVQVRVLIIVLLQPRSVNKSDHLDRIDPCLIVLRNTMKNLPTNTMYGEDTHRYSL